MTTPEADARATCYGCGRPFGGSRDYRWEIAVSLLPCNAGRRFPVSIASVDTGRPRDGASWRWAEVCTACMWKRPPGRRIGIRAKRLAGEIAPARQARLRKAAFSPRDA